MLFEWLKVFERAKHIQLIEGLERVPGKNLVRSALSECQGTSILDYVRDDPATNDRFLSEVNSFVNFVCENSSFEYIKNIFDFAVCIVMRRVLSPQCLEVELAEALQPYF